jgi:hypothetical protein
MIYASSDYRDGIEAHAVEAWEVFERLLALYSRIGDLLGRRLALNALRSVARIYVGARARYPLVDPNRPNGDARRATILARLTSEQCDVVARGATLEQMTAIAEQCVAETIRLSAARTRSQLSAR